MYDLPEKHFVTVDAVVFTILNGDLKILLIQRKYAPFKGAFALPGGFINKNESLEKAAIRELKEETGVKDIYLKLLSAYGDVDRDPRGRVITVSFIAIINSDKIKLHASTDAELAKWHSVKNFPVLAFDHKKIVADALEYLNSNLENTNIASQIMPERFTLSELQQAYEIISGESLDKRNFRKKMHESNILKMIHETRMDGAHRPAELYSFKKTK